MNPKINLILYSVFAAFFLPSCENNAVDTGSADLPDPIKIVLSATEQEIVKTDEQFAFDFFSRVFQEEVQEEKNFMVSPFSLSMALAMTWNGADGETKTAMQQTLKMGDYSDEVINGYYKKLREALLETDPSTQLSIANSIWTNEYIKIKSDFILTNTNYYNAMAKAVDFSNPQTVTLINNWASDNTNGLIKKVIEKTKDYDLMYLLNALYFKGIWASKFKEQNTSKKPFTHENGTSVEVDMMHQTAEFNYTDDETMQVVELPYGNKAFSMFVLLPNEGKKLNDIVSSLQNTDYWSHIESSLSKAEVDLYLPKFKTTYSKKLNSILTDMGMGIAFSEGANFSRMSEVPSKISFVKQDTYINTDEEGTEAAAVTTVVVVVTSMPQKITFNADKPFIYIIQEKSTGAILFMGMVMNFEK